MKRPAPSLIRDEHPTLETFERVLNSGVTIDRGPDDWRRRLSIDISMAGTDLLEFDSESATRPLFDNLPGTRNKRDQD
jgi:hypothetical protein